MNNSSTKQKPDPRLIEIIKSDFKQEDFFKKIKIEFRDLKEFYIDSEKKKRLEKMNWFGRTFNIFWWLIKSMILKLNPIRRLILLAGILFLTFSILSVDSNNDGIQISSRDNLIGGLLIIYLLMLELKDKLLARDELEAGRKIQNSLLPIQNPKIDGWSIWIYTKSANEVGGDLVDFINTSNNNSSLVIGDIAGKGLKAALLMAKLQATIRALAFDYSSIANLISKVNEIFYRDTLKNMFASMIYIDLTADSGKIRFVNAGHLPPFLLTENKIIEMPKGDTAIGLMNNLSFNEHSIELKKEDIFVAYSDGVIEARSEYGTFFGEERLKEILKPLRNLSSENIGQTILFEIDNFIKQAQVHDDISLIVLKKL